MLRCGVNHASNSALHPTRTATRPASGAAWTLGVTMTALEQIDTCRYLYLSSIGEPKDNRLTLRLLEAGAAVAPQTARPSAQH